MEVLLSAPENQSDRAALERRLDELVDAIYRIDQDQLGASAPDDQVSYDKAPLDDILDMTFPIDPSLRGKVREQVRMTVSQLPLEESDAVVSFINFFSSTKGRHILLGGMQRSGRYKAMIERVLAEEGLPEELIFLAQAESGFQPRAVSNKLCVGIWQFAKFRGREYGLDQTPATDDRMDPEKATRAAARHLHDLYEHFGDWYLAMAAYNCGPGCVDNAVMRTGYADFWELRRRNALPLQTANYVPAILAMVIMSKNAEEYGLQDVDFEPAVAYDSLELQTPTHIGLVAAALDRSVSEIKELNPGLVKSIAPGGYLAARTQGLAAPTGSRPAGDSGRPAGFLARASGGTGRHLRGRRQALWDHSRPVKLRESRPAPRNGHVRGGAGGAIPATGRPLSNGRPKGRAKPPQTGPARRRLL